MASLSILNLTTVTAQPQQLIPIADPTQPSGLKNGNITVASLVALAATGGVPPLAPATASLLGGVKIGAGLNVASDGTASVNFGTTTGKVADGGTLAAVQATASGALQQTNLLSEIAAMGSGSQATARSNLGLGAVAVLAVGLGLSVLSGSLEAAFGTGPNQVAMGNDSRIVNAIQPSGNASSLLVTPSAGSASTLSLADFQGNIALLSGGGVLFNTLAQNQTYAAKAANLPAQEHAVGGSTVSTGFETNLSWGVGAYNPLHSNTTVAVGYGAGNAGGGNNNTLGGWGSFNIATGVGQNTGWGARTGINTTTGAYCSFFGSNAGAPNTIGINNTASGHGSVGGLDYVGFQPMVGSNITAAGNWSLQGITGGQDIIGIGVYCGRLINCYLTTTTSSKAVLIGDNIGFNGLGGCPHSVIIGTGALYNSGGPYTTTSSFMQTVNNLSTVGYSVIIGDSCATNLINGGQLLIGYNNSVSMINPTGNTVLANNGAVNVINGGNSLYAGNGVAGNIVNGGSNVYLGAGVATNGAVFFGYISDGGGINPGTVLTVPSGGVTQGPLAVGQVITSSGSTSCTITAQTSGTAGQAGTYTVSVSQLAGSAGAPLVFASADWSNTIAIGNGASPTASNQVWMGNSTTTSFVLGGAGGLAYINSSGINLYGAGAGASRTSGAFHNLFGFNCGGATTTGSYITGQGHGAFAKNTTSSDLAGVGYLIFNNSTAPRQAGIGSNTAINITTGSNNFFGGAYCANAHVTGGYNVELGDGVNTAAGGYDGTHMILIGAGVQGTASNQIIIGSAIHTTAIAGAFTIAAGSTGAAVFGGSVAAAGGFLGQGTGGALAAGTVGYLVSANVPGTAPITGMVTATPINVTSITLPAGNWDVYGNIVINPSAGMQAIAGAVSATSGTLPGPTATGAGSKLFLNTPFTSGGNQAFGVGHTRVQITPAMVTAATNVIYLVAQANFTSGSASCFGYIAAELIG